MAQAIQSITVIGRRWQDRSGNTYFSASVLVDGFQVHRIEAEYGYGDQYLTAAFDWLRRAQMIPEEGTGHPWRYCQDHNINLHYEAADVARKADL